MSDLSKRKTKWSGINNGRKNPMYLGRKASYNAIHQWLRRRNGKANRCWNLKCKKISVRYSWALIRNRYRKSRNINDYLMLCNSCHSKYDKDETYTIKIKKTT